MYTAHPWRRYRKSSMQKLNVAYNDGMRLLLEEPRCSSASQMCVSVTMACAAESHVCVGCLSLNLMY